MRISDWSSDVCSSDLINRSYDSQAFLEQLRTAGHLKLAKSHSRRNAPRLQSSVPAPRPRPFRRKTSVLLLAANILRLTLINAHVVGRSEEHTSELQSLMRISYAVFCLKKKKNPEQQIHKHQ